MNKKKLDHIDTKKNKFKIPKEYFNQLEDTVLAKLSDEKFPDENGYTTPCSYFDTLENTLLEKIQEEDKNTSQTGYIMPKNYLEGVDDAIHTKLKTKAPKIIQFIPLVKRLIPFAIAASLALFIFIKNTNTKPVTFDTITSNDIEFWIDNDMVDLDTYQIAEVYDDVEFTNQDIIDENEALEYLNGMNIETLLLEN